jgi:hypothetical protein
MVRMIVANPTEIRMKTRVEIYPIPYIYRVLQGEHILYNINNIHIQLNLRQ